VRLVTVEHTRARRLADELLGLSPHARGALDALVRGRLVVASERAEGTTYEIAHEALLEGWQTLAAWLVEEAETRAVIHRIETAAGDWRRHGRRRELLWSAHQLAETDAVPAGGLTPREQEFLAASRRSAERARWLRRGAVVALVLGAIGVWIGATIKAQVDRDREIAAELRRADDLIGQARALDAELVAARAAAHHAFDAGRADDGELAWAGVIELRGRAMARYREAGEPLERALLRDGSRTDVRRRYGDLLHERAVVADREHLRDERDELVRRMLVYDDGGRLRRRWDAPAQLSITSDPPGAEIRVRRHVRRGDAVDVDEVTAPGTTPLDAIEVDPGSLVIELAAPGRPPVVYPVVVGRGERVAIDVPVPPSIPAGFAYVPPGASLFGSTDAEEVRAFFFAVPAHRVWTDGYLIAIHETTYGEWIEFLEALPEPERDRRAPLVGSVGAKGQGLALIRVAGRWELSFQPGSVPLRAAAGEPIVYTGRRRNAAQDWLRMPVGGVSYDDAVAYAAWLDRTGRVAGARLCTEPEWERAARGADDRAYPHGWALRAEDANIDETYGKDAVGFGPDEVGSYPASRSVFGVDDLAGNVWEWVSSHLTAHHSACRGGSFSYAAPTARIANRELPQPSWRDVGLGVRICASLSRGE
jgi:eukaryotic-like serine/threonine-protein kinase